MTFMLKLPEMNKPLYVIALYYYEEKLPKCNVNCAKLGGATPAEGCVPKRIDH